MNRAGGSPVLTIAELRLIADRLVGAVGNHFGEQIELEADYYWDVDPAESLNLESQPELRIGQVSDDLAELRAWLSGGDTVVWHELDHFVGLLNCLVALARD